MLRAQVTTAEIQGYVYEDSGEPLFSATVVVVHEPTGKLVGTITKENGRFDIRNLKIGGPYRLEVSFIGYNKQVKKGLFLNIGDKLSLKFTLKSSSFEMGDIVVKAKSLDNIISSDKTGASTSIGKTQLNSLPTISRSAADFTRLTPSADGNSFAGRNSQFNNFSLDGSIFNNPMGLDAATPGGQSNAQPISLDAIEQIQVNLAPYDVTLAGFTGASVNAVTKSGTNEFHGSVFAYYRNQDLTGRKVKDETVFRADLKHLQSGFNLGGPIIKNKLFFFTNLEIERRSDLGSSFLAGRPGLEGNRVSRVQASDLDAVSRKLKEKFGYETGSYENYSHRTDNLKGLLKLDWNINNKHSLTATYNFLDASQEKPAHPEALGRRGPDQTTLQFYNSGYEITNRLHSGMLELKSNFSDKFANNLQVGVSYFNDFRTPFSEPFPVLNINKDGSRYIVAGHEPFSIYNTLHQTVYQATNNFNVFLDNHTLTVGTSFERFNFSGTFNLGYNEPFQPADHPNPYLGGTFGNGFPDVQSFLDYVDAGHMDEIVQYARNRNKDADWKRSRSSFGQWALYIQDEWHINPKLVITYGIRMDKPLYFNSADYAQKIIDRDPGNYIPDATYFNEKGEPVQLDQTKLPKETPLISPRIGFNWDITGDKTSQLRGGAGVFAGRLPFVWLANQISDPSWFYRQVTAPDFKFPQVFRFNLGYDQKYKGGWTSSLDMIYTKDINGMIVRNYGLNLPTGVLSGVDNRLIYTSGDMASPLGFPYGAGPYVFTNTDIGYSFNSTFQLRKQWQNGTSASLAYNFLVSKDASSIPAEISGDAFNRNPALGNVNKAVESDSRYGSKHRFVGTFNKRVDYGKGKWGTSLGIFMEYNRGGRFSYTYSGDINGDTSPLNDLIYIPTSEEINLMKFSGNAEEQNTQRKAFDNYIEQDKYLRKNRGSYAEKYAGLLPWYSRWDVKLQQDYKLNNGNMIQFSIDILNFGNLLNSNWGIRQNPTNTQPIGVSVEDGIPTYSFDPNLKNSFSYDFGLASRWQVQFGLRYRF